MNDSRVVGRWILTAAVLTAVGSAVARAVIGEWEAVVRFGLLAVVMLLARYGAIPPPFAGAFASLILLATWASVEHWYREIDNFDVLVHLLAPGSIAAAGYFVLAHRRWLPQPVGEGDLRPSASVLWVLLVGTAAAVLWEFYEWIVAQIAPQGIIVGYTDTIGDLLAGMASSTVAGFLVLLWARSRRSTSRSADAPSKTTRGLATAPPA